MKYNREEHKFFCLNCGKPTFTIQRPKSHLHETGHRKKLYCPWCKEDCNTVEIKNIEEEKNFLEAYTKGEFEEEAKQSILYIKNERVYK